MPATLEVPVLPVARLRAVVALSEGLPEREILSALVNLANADPELTATVVRAANSAFSAPRFYMATG